MDNRHLVGALLLSLACSNGGKGGGGSTGGVPGGNTGGATTGGARATGGAAAGGAATGGAAATGGGATGGAGTGGATMGGAGGRDAPGTGGVPPGGTGGTPPATGASVLQRNKNLSRDGHFIEPGLTKAKAATMALQPGFAAAFMGNMWASPLFLENGPGGKGLFFAVTTNNNVYALDETTGAVVWMKNVGAPAMLNGPNANCGNIHPLGILATPVIDAQARTIFISAAVGNATQILRQEVHALSVDDGSSRPGWPVDVSGKVGFDPQPHNPRSALSLVNGIVYVAYGGHVGDCGDYHGRVVAIDSKDPTKVVGWATGGRGEAIWAPGGMASDGVGVIATTGNRTGGPGAGHLDSEQVLRIRGMVTLNRGPEDIFFPANWQQMDSTDADFGSSSPIVIDVPAAMPSKMVAATAKTGHIYFLDAARLGGMGGQLVDYTAGGGGFTAPTAYQTTKGTFMALTLNQPRCPMGYPGGAGVVGILLGAGMPVKPETVWCAPIMGGASPISTTTDGKSESLVWFTSAGRLMAVDGETGVVVFNGGTGTCSGVRKWTSPIVAKGRVVAGGDGHLCSWAAP